MGDTHSEFVGINNYPSFLVSRFQKPRNYLDIFLMLVGTVFRYHNCSM